MSRGARLYRMLLALLPRTFREEFGEELCRVADEQWSGLRPRPGPAGEGWFWLRQGAALVRAAAGLEAR